MPRKSELVWKMPAMGLPERHMAPGSRLPRKVFHFALILASRSYLYLQIQIKKLMDTKWTSEELFRNTIDSSTDMIQVFKAVRNETGEIVDFHWIFNNKTSESHYGNVIGMSLLELNPGVVKVGIFDEFRKVVETGRPNISVHRYQHEQFNGWFHQSSVKLGDGISTTTRDITELIKTQELLQKAETDKHREMLEMTMRSLEEERSRISESLHNGVGQTLYAVKLYLSRLSDTKVPAERDEILSTIDDLVSSAIREIRSISHELVPISFENVGLKNNVEEVIKRLGQDIVFRLRYLGPDRIADRNLELGIFRIFQELINNVIKHSKCDLCRIFIKVGKKEIHLVVQDNGIGIKPENQHVSGIGIQSIRAKMKMLQGNLSIESDGGRGTKIEIRVPVP
jgi:signal transduction histidine kinase